jgi:serine/threonine protein kinase
MKSMHCSLRPLHVNSWLLCFVPQVRLHIGLQHENIIDLYAAWQEAGNVVLVQVGWDGAVACHSRSKHTLAHACLRMQRRPAQARLAPKLPCSACMRLGALSPEAQGLQHVHPAGPARAAPCVNLNQSSMLPLLQEFAGHGDLWSFIDSNSGRLTERVTVSLVLQPFLRGLQFLHSAGIAHR